jgi:hypothetical protein
MLLKIIFVRRKQCAAYGMMISCYLQIRAFKSVEEARRAGYGVP